MKLRRRFSLAGPRQAPPQREARGSRFRISRVSVLLVALVTLVMFTMWLQHALSSRAREHELRQELSQLRQAIQAYTMVYGRLPADLSSLVRLGVYSSVKGKRIKLVEEARLDDDGRVLDPFGRPYSYDPLSGAVVSTSPCCLNW